MGSVMPVLLVDESASLDRGGDGRFSCRRDGSHTVSSASQTRIVVSEYLLNAVDRQTNQQTDSSAELQAHAACVQGRPKNTLIEVTARCGATYMHNIIISKG